MRVLVVEDFEVLAEAIGTGLRREGMAVDVVLDGNAALEHLAVTRYDVVVLDRDLPGVHGDEVCRRLGGRAVAEPDPDADRGQHGQGAGRRPRPGRRRLPAQAVRLRRAGRAGPRPRPPQPARRCPARSEPATSRSTRPGGSRSGPAGALSSAPKEFALLECLLAAAGPGRLRRGAAGTGLGRSGRPVHHRGQDDGAPAAGQARRPARHPDRPRGRLPDRRP